MDWGIVRLVDGTGSGVGIWLEMHEVEGMGAGMMGMYSSDSLAVSAAWHFLFGAILGRSISSAFTFFFPMTFLLPFFLPC